MTHVGQRFDFQIRCDKHLQSPRSTTKCLPIWRKTTNHSGMKFTMNNELEYIFIHRGRLNYIVMMNKTYNRITYKLFVLKSIESVYNAYHKVRVSYPF